MAPPWKPSARTSGRFRSIRIVDETGSTNRDLAQEAVEGAPAGAVLIARHQTAGRGRQGRTWFDQPDSSLLMSWSIDIDASLAPLLSLVSGVAVCEAVEQVIGADVAALKWPNDVLSPGHGERKLAGILAEIANVSPAENRPSRTLRVIMGMGINIDLSLDNAPQDVIDRAVDLRTLAGGVVDRAVFLDALLDACDSGIDQLEASTAAVLERYRSRCLTLGRTIRFETSNGELHGQATAIADDGSLVLTTADGVAHHLTAGDAHHRA